LKVFPANHDPIDPGLELARRGEIVHGRADDDDIGGEKFVEGCRPPRQYRHETLADSGVAP